MILYEINFELKHQKVAISIFCFLIHS